MAKSLRSRLGLPSARQAKRENSRDRAVQPTQQEEEDKEIWASIADLA